MILRWTDTAQQQNQMPTYFVSKGYLATYLAASVTVDYPALPGWTIHGRRWEPVRGRRWEPVLR